ncbi:MAG TPA: hypothetical protein VH417_07890 [Vicinamibacterales bacterium]
MLRALVTAAALAAATLAAGCSTPKVDPLQLDRGILTVSNTTPDGWTNVEIWVNQQFRVTVPSIAANSRFQVPLNSFVEGFGRRFDFSRMQIRDLRLIAKSSSGAPVELKKEFQKGGLDGIQLGGKP